MYSQRIVAFIDILGFSNSIREKTFEEIKAIVDDFTKFMKHADRNNSSRLAWAHVSEKLYDKKYISDDTNKDNLSFFSDCVVWSYPTSEIKVKYIHVILSLFGMFSVLQQVLYSKRVLIRGGVTIGNIYHSGNVVFGEALVKAVELEKQADYPRIVFDSIFLTRLDHRLIPMLKHHAVFNPKGFFALDLIKQVKFLNRWVIEEMKTGKDVDVTRDIVLKGLVDSLCTAISLGINSPSRTVRRKYEWMHSKLTSVQNLQVPINL